MHRLNNFVLGAAFDANWSNASGKASACGVDSVGNKISMHYKARLKNSLQLYAKLGYVIRETVMPFIGLGWDNSQWERSLNVVNEDIGYRAYQKKTQRLNTGLWKFGFDVLAAKNVIVGFEYTGTLGKNKNHTVPIANNVGSVNTSFKPQYNKFALTTKFIF